MTTHRLADDPILAALEATLLGPDVTLEVARDLVRKARVHGVRGVCLPFADLFELHAAGELPGGLDRVTVAGFPFGDLPEAETLRVARRAHEAGAHYVDVVFRRDRVLRGTVPEAQDDLPVRVILETSAFGSQAEMLRAAEALVRHGYRHLKTSTGFHPSQSSPQVDAVRALSRTFGEEVTIKASGKIRSREDAARLLEAGARRLGASALEGLLPDRGSPSRVGPG